ncbi:hypothetical protein LCGC14_1882010 [marine sediment metagenome]|uniref:ParB-like N-terminal domain-containing protein n=1 Tax=marine sediment metagenome TaxID=412755 RepID=A0A0F9J0D1_9ZZZZ
MKQKILEIKDIEIDDRVYPRTSMDYYVIAKYMKAMKSGSVFPSIIVAKYEGKYLLVDGAHRLTTNKQLKNKHIEAEVLEGLSLEELYIESVKRNSTHGTSFATIDVTKICLKLKNMKLSLIEISKIVHIPADKIEPYIAKRITRIGITQQEVPLKSAYKHFAGKHLDQPINQDVSIGVAQINMINSLIGLLENNHLDVTNELVIERIKKLYNLLEPYS